MGNHNDVIPVRAGQRLARFNRLARNMILSATDDGGTMLDLVAHEPGGQERPIAVFERTEDGSLVHEWSLGAYILGLQHGSKAREGVLAAVHAVLDAFLDETEPDPELGVELLLSPPGNRTEQANNGRTG